MLSLLDAWYYKHSFVGSPSVTDETVTYVSDEEMLPSSNLFSL